MSNDDGALDIKYLTESNDNPSYVASGVTSVFKIKDDGTVNIPDLAGGGTQMVVTDNNGDLSSLSIPTDDQTAAEVSYSNITSGLSATNVQAAIDEINVNTINYWNRDVTNGEVYPANINDDVGIRTANPIANLHVNGSNTLGKIAVTPSQTGSGDDAEVFLGEDHDGTYGMSLVYDGGDNNLYIKGKNGSTNYGPMYRLQETTVMLE